MEASNALTGDSSRIPLKLFITTSSLGTVSVSISAPFAKDTYPGENITVTKGVVRQVKLPKSLRVLGTKRSHKAVHINSSDEIVVFGVNGADFSTDGFLGIPVDVLGAQYFVPSFYSNSQRFYKSAIVIVGTKDRTSLQIKIKSTNGGIIILENKRYGNNDWLNTTISRFEVLQLQCRSDLTGTFVQSSQKISVFGGSTVTNIGTGTSRDHIEEQIPPVNVWGKRFAMSPVPHTNPNVIRVLASEDDTMITINNHGIHTLQSGQFYETKVSSADFISSNKPVLTVQYVPSAYDGQNGDPAMTLVPPIEQSNVFYSFLTPKSSQNENFENTFNFLMEGLSYKGLVLDDKLLRREDFFSVAQINNISTGYIKIPHGSHTLRHSSGTLPFGGILYGGAKYESYAFPVGQRFTPINQECQPQPVVVGDGLDNDCDGRVDEEICNDNKDRQTMMEMEKKTKIVSQNSIFVLRNDNNCHNEANNNIHKFNSQTSYTNYANYIIDTDDDNKTTNDREQTNNINYTDNDNKTTDNRERNIGRMSMDERRPQWFTLTEIGIISGVSIVVLGAIGMCCKKCWGLLKDRDDDDDEDEKRYRRKRRSTTKLPIGAPSIRPMYM
uniref:IgGFc-binding protein n=1 Tax=Magallana gigas TaxID=29159 RepID=K1PP14_MAGGI